MEGSSVLNVTDWILLLFICFSAALGAVIILQRPAGRARLQHRCGLETGSEDPILLFDGDTLLDATQSGHDLLERHCNGKDWAALHQALSDQFPDLPRMQSDLRDGEMHTYLSGRQGDSSEISIERVQGRIRVHLRPPAGAHWSDSVIDRLRHDLNEARGYLNEAPFPMWHTDDEGQIRWANRAHERLADHIKGENRIPLAPLFEPLVRTPGPVAKKRQCLTVAETGRTLWFEVTCTQQEAGCIYSAVDIDAIVSAEIAQRNFVQTLAKTFAQLPTGLAIFDRNRQLALFNPALIDLTTLPADFLSARPSILSFFDRLRENRMIPEPKDYTNWRNQMADLVEAACDGSYQETWSLASGSIYQVSGRPHPDGAVAFLFEDITAEVTLTRRFRSDIELGQSILNKLEEAVVVFSETGTLSLCNSAYCELWATDPDASFAETTILDATRQWQEKCQATPVWGDIRDCIAPGAARASWSANITMKDGVALRCEVHPIQNANTMITFRALVPTEAGESPASLQRAAV